jgi:hypothetical protein
MRRPSIPATRRLADKALQEVPQSQFNSCEESKVANGRTDVSRLQGNDLQRWYARSPQVIEAERQKAEAEKHAQFVASIRGAEPENKTGGFRSPLEMAKDALHDFQTGPKIARPNMAQSFIPVVGSAWEAAADLQDGNYAGAAFNGAMAVADLLPVGPAAKGIKAAEKGITILKKGSVTAGAAAKQIRKAGLAKKGDEIHHTIPLNGTSRSVQDPRNHYAFLKVLPQEQHRRLTGRWNGKPMYDPIRKIWYGTTDWQKAVPVAVASYSTDAFENVARPFVPRPPSNAGSNPRR